MKTTQKSDTPTRQRRGINGDFESHQSDPKATTSTRPVKIIRGGALAASIYRKGGLRDTLAAGRHNRADAGRPPRNQDGTRTYRLIPTDGPERHVDLAEDSAAYESRWHLRGEELVFDAPPATRCPDCGLREPGFVDSDHPEQRVECDQCGYVTTYGEWLREGGR